MPASERLPKQAPVQSKPAHAAPTNEQTKQIIPSQMEVVEPLSLLASQFSHSTIIRLQREVGNHAVQQMIKLPQTGAMHLPPLDVDTHDTPSSESGKPIQREITKLPGKSSGVFGKGRRDKINVMVQAYNKLEMGAVGPKATIANIQKLLPEIQKIWQAAREWQVDTMKKNPEKAATIAAWITSEVEREEDAKKASIGELQEAASLKAASDGAAYNVAYTTPEFTIPINGAGVKWLQTPTLAPIYRYFIIALQHDGATLSAYEDMARYKANPTKAEALRIYDKYEMAASNQLNIAGEGAGGIDAVNATRAQINALRAGPNAPVPANFGAIEKSVTYVINELFTTFRDTTPFKKVTTAPPAG